MFGKWCEENYFCNNIIINNFKHYNLMYKLLFDNSVTAVRSLPKRKTISTIIGSR